MYELQNINKDINNKFYQAIFKAMQKENWHSIACLSVESTFHDMLPNFPKYELEKYIKVLLKPILEAKEKNFKVREFLDESERNQVYENTYGNLINELLESERIEDKYNLDLIYYIYDLLEYDKVIIIDSEKYLYSFMYISSYAQTHLKAYEQLSICYENKPSNKNIDIATNKTKDKKSQLNFLNPMLKPVANNKLDPNNKAAQLKLNFIKNYETEYRMIARSVHQLAKLKECSENFEVNTIGSLETHINSDGITTNHDIYISWYAHIYTIYKSSNIPVTQKLKLAKLSSYVIFPNLRDTKKLIVNEKTAIKPIREVSMFRDLRLLEFTDDRTTLKRTNEEIKFSEEYLTKVTKYLNRYS